MQNKDGGGLLVLFPFVFCEMPFTCTTSLSPFKPILIDMSSSNCEALPFKNADSTSDICWAHAASSAPIDPGSNVGMLLSPTSLLSLDLTLPLHPGRNCSFVEPPRESAKSPVARGFPCLSCCPSTCTLTRL